LGIGKSGGIQWRKTIGPKQGSQLHLMELVFFMKFKRLFFILIIIFAFSNVSLSFAFWTSEVIGNQEQDQTIVTIGSWNFNIIYDFNEVSLVEMIEQGANIATGNFTDTGTEIQSSNGLLYIPNGKESYTLTLDAQILTSGTIGGYGLLFESSATNMLTLSDTGFVVQFDRGYTSGEIIIRPRTNGGEGSPVARYSVRFNGQGNFVTNGGSKNSNNPWWMQAHLLKLVVSVHNPILQQKKVSVYIDDIYLFEYVFTSNLFGEQAQNNITGFRTWSNVNVAFYGLSIQ
jgi:hypothetical protein